MKTTAANSEPIRIGALAQKTGCSVPTIRYYEEVGLIPAASRRSSGHRVYDDAAVAVLCFIRRCRAFGFTLDQTRALLSLADKEERDCVEARDIAQGQLTAVRAKMVDLMSLERSLVRFVDSCNANCAGGPAPKCTILKDLGLGDEDAAKQGRCCA